MRYFCTYFDHRYLPRGLALYWSLRRTCPSFKLWVLSLDSECFNVLSELRLPNVHVIALEEFERRDEELLEAKKNRSLIEYYFTCTPCLPLSILNDVQEVDVITYLDADLFFFSDPEPLYAEISESSIAIIEHRLSPHLRHLARSVGIYNVGWLSFRRNEDGFACLRWWREKCIEWCHDRPENGRYADQKYLDDWSLRFRSVVVLQHKGANLAPWNVANYKLSANGNSVFVDDQPLIFFHFHGFKQIGTWMYDPNLALYSARCYTFMRRSIFGPYIRVLQRATSQAASRRNLSLGSEIRSRTENQAPVQQPTLYRRLGPALRWRLDLCKGILQERYILVINGIVMQVVVGFTEYIMLSAIHGSLTVMFLTRV